MNLNAFNSDLEGISIFLKGVFMDVLFKAICELRISKIINNSLRKILR